jgi:hypothetical protein
MGGRLTVKIMISLMEVEENTSLKVLLLWKSSITSIACEELSRIRLNIQHCVSKFKKLQP